MGNNKDTFFNFQAIASDVLQQNGDHSKLRNRITHEKSTNKWVNTWEQMTAAARISGAMKMKDFFTYRLMVDGYSLSFWCILGDSQKQKNDNLNETFRKQQSTIDTTLTVYADTKRDLGVFTKDMVT